MDSMPFHKPQHCVPEPGMRFTHQGLLFIAGMFFMDGMFFVFNYFWGVNY